MLVFVVNLFFFSLSAAAAAFSYFLCLKKGNFFSGGLRYLKLLQRVTELLRTPVLEGPWVTATCVGWGRRGGGKEEQSLKVM